MDRGPDAAVATCCEFRDRAKSCLEKPTASGLLHHNKPSIVFGEAGESTTLATIFQKSSTMAGLFGSAASTSQANTLGDLSKDVALNSPPDDSVSDLSFSPQSDHLAVASWDKKVRIYQITQNGGSEGKAFFEHDAPVLSCHWSPVSPRTTVLFDRVLTAIRMAQRLLEQGQISRQR